MRALFSLVAGVLFALGLGISGMTNPDNVIGFLDFAGDWKPALALVMGGGVLTYGVAFRLIKRRPSPLLGGFFQIPTKRDIDARLVIGAALFGAGWGLGGFCPGPAFVSLATGAAPVLIFVGTMALGMLAFQWLDPTLQAWEARRNR